MFLIKTRLLRGVLAPLLEHLWPLRESISAADKVQLHLKSYDLSMFCSRQCPIYYYAVREFVDKLTASAAFTDCVQFKGRD